MTDTEASRTGEAAQVPFRRHVLYIPGYDPFPARRYREIYRKEGAAQAAISGYSLAMKGRQGAGYGWQVSTVMERPAEAEVEVLIWDDLVKGSMQRGVIGTYALLARVAWLYLASGALVRLVGLRKGPMIAALYPAVALILQALLAGLVGLAYGRAGGLWRARGVPAVRPAASGLLPDA